MNTVSSTTAFLFLLVVIGSVSAFDTKQPLPHIPKQFTADLVVTAHQLDPSKSYPPSERRIEIAYDAVRGMVYAKIVSGYESGRTYIRRYDLKKEYMVRGGKYPECRRSYLGETLPEVLFSRKIKYQGETADKKRPQKLNYWTEESYDSKVHIFHDGRLPVRATEESVFEGKTTPLSTYEFQNMKIGQPPDSFFQLPEQYTHESCDRQVDGFPYIHAFLHYLKF